MEHSHRRTRRHLLGAAALSGSGIALGALARPAAVDAQATPVAGETRIGPPAWYVDILAFQDPYAGVIQAPSAPPPGTRYVAAELSIENDSDQPLNFTPTEIRVRDVSGAEHRGGTAIGTESMLNARNLAGGERLRGWVWFTIPAEAELVALTYTGPAPQYVYHLTNADQ